MRPFNIGDTVIDIPAVLGPMAGVTDQAFRLLCREQGAGLLYTEMISAKAILYHNRGTEALMEIDQDRERPVALQLFGREPEIMAEAAAMIADRPFDILDINMGCPVPKVVNNGEGSALMREPELAAKIVSSVARRIRKPVTVKIRSGPDAGHVNAADFARAMEQAGASAVAVHGRTREQLYSGRADWSVIRAVKEAVTVPVLGSGDADSPEAASLMMEETGCDGIMIARGARGDPWIFQRVRAYLEKGELLPRPCAREIHEMILRHMEMLLERKGENTGVREMRKHIGWYTAGLPGSSAIRRRVNEVTDIREVRTVLSDYFSALEKAGSAR